MRHRGPWRGLSFLIPAACLAGCARPAGPELRIVLQVHTDEVVHAASAALRGLTPQRIEQIHQQTVAETLDVLRARLHQIGIEEDAVLEPRGGQRIHVRLHGVEDPQRVSTFLSSTALLELRFVRFPKGGGGIQSRAAILEHFGGPVPAGLEILAGDARNDRGEVTGNLYYAVEKNAVITSRDIQSARPEQGPFDTRMVEFRLKPASAKSFGEATGANIGSGLAMVFDGQVIAAPQVTSRIEEGGVIQGKFSQAEVEDMAAALRAGPLPARVSVVEQEILRPEA